MSRPDAIGGYFSLELPVGGNDRFPTALKFQSARSALLALLRAGRPERIWMPWFICDSMLEPALMANIPVARYGLDTNFRILSNVEIGPKDWLLHVNYFGLSSQAIEDTLHRFPADRVIIDCAQAFFAPPADCLATIYSPRKFVGVPDGGYLVTARDVDLPAEQDNDSVNRSQHLLLRADQGAEVGYANFSAAEASLTRQEPKRMSLLTEKMLNSINYNHVRERRRENYALLHSHLQSSNLLRPELEDDAVPLCYPYMCDDPALRSHLIQARIFVATYWPDVIVENSQAPVHEQTLSRRILPLPCDQRYKRDDMQRILDIIQNS